MQNWKRDLVGELMPRIIDAATAYNQSNDARGLAHIDDWFNEERERIEGALVKVQFGYEKAHVLLADAKVQASKWERKAYEADQRGSRELAIDYMKDLQQANAAVEEYETLLSKLEPDLDRLTQGRQVLESEHGKLRQKVQALRLLQGSAEALSDLKDGLKTLEKAHEELRDAQERVNNNVAQQRAEIEGVRKSPHVRRGYLERDDLENQLKELRGRQGRT